MDFRWYALAVRSNAEKAVVLSLQRRALRTFLPMYRVRRRWSGCAVVSRIRLFPLQVRAAPGGHEGDGCRFHRRVGQATRTDPG